MSLFKDGKVYRTYEEQLAFITEQVKKYGMVNLEKTSTVGLVDTYTITYQDGRTSTFTVTNGKDGVDGTNGTDGVDGVDGVGISTITANQVDATVTVIVTLTNGTTQTFTFTAGGGGGAPETEDLIASGIVTIATSSLTSFDTKVIKALRYGKVVHINVLLYRSSGSATPPSLILEGLPKPKDFVNVLFGTNNVVLAIIDGSVPGSQQGIYGIMNSDDDYKLMLINGSQNATNIMINYTYICE